MTGTDELLPCPFCQKGMMLRAALWPSEGDRDAIIHAAPTDCPLGDFSNDTFDRSIVEVWNRRAPAHPTMKGGQIVGYANLYRKEDGGFELGGSDVYPSPEPEWGDFAGNFVGPVALVLSALLSAPADPAPQFLSTEDGEFNGNEFEGDLTPAPTAPAPSDAGVVEALLDGKGWVFWNPDSGEEYSANHPVDSGECEDAENIRRSTGQEDVLWQALQAQPVLRAAPAGDVEGDPTQRGYIEVIKVEKLLLAKLGREWAPSGFSIVSLIEALASRSPNETLEQAAAHLAEIAKAMWERCESKRPDDQSVGAGEADDATTAWLFEKAADAVRSMKEPE